MTISPCHDTVWGFIPIFLNSLKPFKSILCVAASIWVGSALSAQTVTIPDPGLQQAILDHLGRTSGPITTADMSTITSLTARNYGITYLGGLDAAPSLENLDLGNDDAPNPNRINDLTLIENLAHKLVSLNIENNQVSDLSPFVPLIPSFGSKLTTLNLSGNKIKDLNPLTAHPNLERLYFNQNLVSDLSPLSSLTSLTALYFSQNRVIDASPLSTLTSLNDLRAGQNFIENLDFLTSLPLIQVLLLDDNEIVDLTRPASLPSLTYLTVTENRLNLEAGGPQRPLIDALLARPLTFIYEPQKLRPPVTPVSLFGMGANFYGEIGQGELSRSNIPTWVDIDIQSIAAGAYHGLYITEDGVLWAMGHNDYGQLGDGTTVSRATPVMISSDVQSASAGESHSLFIKNDGTLWAMGSNLVGELGDGTGLQQNTPVQVASDVKSVSAGTGYTLFLKTDGHLWAMGWNAYGQLGLPGLSNRLSATPVVSGVRAIATGSNHSLYVKDDDTLWATGYNLHGKLGTDVVSSVAVQVATDVQAASAGGSHSLFLKNDDSLWAMGWNAYGQLGDGTKVTQRSPVQVATEVEKFSAGSNHSLYIKKDGSLWAMGDNSQGQLGNGTGNGTAPNSSATPELIDQAAWAVSAGSSHSLFLAESYRLSTSTANGTITKNPDREYQPLNGVANLTAVPDLGYQFQRWLGDRPVAQEFSNPLILTMDQDRAVSAVFQLKAYSLAIGSANGTVTRNPNAGIYAHGDTVILTATPNTGYLFTHWSGDVAPADDSKNPITITMDANKVITAQYVATYTLNTTAANGTVSRDLAGPTYVQNTAVKLTATPNTGYSFVNWTGDVAAGLETQNPLTVTMDANKSITAVFAINTYTLNTNALNGGILRVPNLAVHAHGTPVTLTAIPGTGYQFAKWTGDIPAIAETTNPYTVTMDRNKAIFAQFELKAYPLTILSPNGTVLKVPNQATYLHGTEVTVTATPNADFHFWRWTGNQSFRPVVDNPMVVTMDQARTLTAQFVENLSSPDPVSLSRDWFLGNSPASTVVGLLSAPDSDAGDNVSFALVPGSGDADNARFKIVGDELQTNSAFNDTRQETFRILVEARDLANHTTTTALLVRSVPTRPYAILTERATFTTRPSYVSVLFKMHDETGAGINLPKEFIDSQPDLFLVREDGGLLSPSESFLQIAKFEEVPYKLRTVILIDNSFSVRDDLSAIKDAAKVVVDQMFQGQEIAIYSFSEMPTLEQGFTNDPVLLNNAISGITLGLPTTNLYGSILTALNQWNEVFVVNGFSGLTAPDLLNTSAWAALLKSPGDPVSTFIRSQLSAGTQILVDGFVSGVSDPVPLQDALVIDLNAMLEGPSIYDAARFAGVALRPETRVLLDVDPSGEDLVELNRLLLEDAYPTDLARKQANVIETGNLVVLTDGNDQSGLATLAQVRNKRDTEGKNIFAIGLGDEIEPATLADIGNAYNRSGLEVDALRDAFAEVQERIKNDANSFYWLNYASPKRGNFTRTLTVALKGNRNSGGILATTFPSNGFSSIMPGLVLNRSVFRPNGVSYLNIATTATHALRAFTLLAFDTPNYTWAIGDPDLADLIPSDLDPAQIEIHPKLNGLTTLTVQDVVNGYSVTIPLRIQVPELVGLVVMIRSSPSDLSVVEGSPATLIGVVNENVPGVVSWEFRGLNGIWTPIAGANSPVLTINPAGRADSGDYRLVYTLGQVTAYSDPALLRVAFLSATNTSSGAIRLAFVAEEGTSFELELSRDLVNWIPAGAIFTREGDSLLTTVLPENGPVYFREAN